MPLTVQQDGSVVGGNPNTVVAKWWNDYHDLLTGVMTDQDVTLATDLILKPIGTAPAAPSAVAQAGTGLGIGAYQYGVVFIKQGQGGFSSLGATVSVTTTSGNQNVGLSNIPLGPTGTASRALYRTVVGGATFGYLATINDNTTTTYVDTTADGSLGGAPNESSFGGSLIIKDSSGDVQITLFPDGGAVFNSYISTSQVVSPNNQALTIRVNGKNTSFNTDGTVTLTYAGAAGTLAPIVSGGGGSAGKGIWVGTSDPGTNAAEGDIWIKA